MKKSVRTIFALLLVVVLGFAIPGAATAGSDDDPVVTPISGDALFTTEVVSIASLPGLSELGQMLVPAGFPKGEAQFGGNGIRVTGMDYGKATACFSLSTSAVNQGWGGKVGVWNGSKWVLLPTTLTAQDESNTTLACAPISGSGIYVFIKYIADPSLLSTTCGFNFSGYYENNNRSYGAIFGSSYMEFTMLFFNPDFPLGLPVNYTIHDQSPAGIITENLTGSSITRNDYPEFGPNRLVYFPVPIYAEYNLNFYVTLEYPTLGCSQTLYFPVGNYFYPTN